MIELICLCMLSAVIGSAVTVVIYEVVKLVHWKKDLSVNFTIAKDAFENRKLKAIYIGSGGKAHKVWDRDEFENGAKKDEV